MAQLADLLVRNSIPLFFFQFKDFTYKSNHLIPNHSKKEFKYDIVNPKCPVIYFVIWQTFTALTFTLYAQPTFNYYTMYNLSKSNQHEHSHSGRPN